MGAQRHNGRRAVLFVLCAGTLPLFPGAAAAADADSPAVTTLAESATASSSQTEQVTITGTRLRPAQTQSAQDLHIYELPRIEQSGQSTVTDFLATLPEVSLNSVESTNGGTTVRVRGAIRGSVLVLINGRRIQPVTGGVAPFGFFDLNTIPLALVERIEVLPSGSSAIYGGDALAGVVNVVLRSDFTGVEAEAGYKCSVSIMGTYSDRSPLFGRDRDITANPDLRRFGGPNLGTQILGVPATVTSVSGNLPGLNSSLAAVPIGSTGVGLTPSSFAATAGTQNTGSFNRYQSLIPEAHRGGVFASANYRFGSALEVFAEMLGSAYKFNEVSTPPFVQLMNLPASNAFNPFGTAVRISGVVQGAENFSKFTYNEDFLRPLVGARGTFAGWDWEVTALTARDKGSLILHGQTNTPLLNAAFASSNPATALNPFIDGPWGSASQLASIYSNTSITSYKADSNIVNGFVRGSLFMLPGGPLDAVVGGEYEDSTLKRNFDASRNAKSGFAELRAPVAMVMTESGAERELLTLQGAVRYDDYSDFGSQTTWQAGIELRPTDSILLRGTHATAFKPPTLYNLGAPVTSAPLAVQDPLNGNQTVVVPASTGGTSDLKPTTGTSTTAGLVWSPRRVPGLNLSLTDWHLRIDNSISLPQPQFVINNANLYPGRVTRAPAPPGQVGQITSVNSSYVNFGTMRESGIDANIEYSFATEFGVFTPAIALTYMTEYKGASTAGAPVVNRLSRANSDLNFAPRWKGTASIGWAPDGPFKLWLAGRYIGQYQDYTPPRTIGDIWYYDATLEIDIVRALHVTPPLVNGIKLLVSATNLADTLPPYSTYFRGYDPENYDLVGRTIFVRLQFQT